MYTFPNLSLCPEGKITFNDLLKYNCTSTQMLFGKAECFKSNPFDPGMPRFQDWEECFRHSSKFNLYHQNEVLVDTYQQKDSITKNPQKGVLGMNKLLDKHLEAILAAPDITESFFKKMANFTCRCGKNPVKEYSYIAKAKPVLKNRIILFLCKIKVYKILFLIKIM